MVRRILFPLLLLQLALPALALASTTYYVDCSAGNDSNPGTSVSAAWSTVTKVNSVAYSPGDTILFKKGCTWTDAYLYTTSSGLAGSPITFGAYGSGAQPIFSGQTYGLYVHSSYVTIDGLHFSHATTMGIISGNANITGVVVENSTVDYSTKSGIFLYGNAPGSYTVGNFTFLHNIVANNGTTTDDQGIYIDNSNNNILDGNTWDSNAGYGVQIQDSSDNNTVRYNYFHNNGFAGSWGGALTIYNNQTSVYHLPTGNQIYGNVSNGDRYGLLVGGTTATVNNTVVNNTFYGNQYGLIIQSGITFGTFKNNIVWSTNTAYPLDVTGSVSSDYNIVGPAHSGFIQWNGSSYDSLGTYSSATGNDSHSKASDPLFVNSSSANFTLQSTSPAIDAGVNAGTAYQMELDPTSTFPWTTLNENSYGKGWDIGAFIFTGTGTAPNPPTGLIGTVN